MFSDSSPDQAVWVRDLAEILCCVPGESRNTPSCYIETQNTAEALVQATP